MAVPPGVSLALSDGPLDDPPSWTRLDTEDGLHVTELNIKRGRPDMRSKTSPGTASVSFVDEQGVLDPTNTSGPFYGNLDPVKQTAISLRNPMDGNWNWLYRGHLDSISSDLHVSERWLETSLDAVDMLDLLDDAEVIPDEAGNVLAPGDPEYLFYKESQGDCFYTGQNVHDRILAVLADASTAYLGVVWPASLLQIASGNVYVQGRAYSARSSLLQVIDEAVDADGPYSTNRFITKDGAFAFRGRFYRYSPDFYLAASDADRGEPRRMVQWNVGDLAAAESDGTIAVFSGLKFERGKTNLINSGLITPIGIAEENVAAQGVVDHASIGEYGVRTDGMSLSDLIIAKSSTEDNTAVQEAKSFAHAVVDNQAQPVTRVSQLVFTNPPAGASTARQDATWALICGVELSDLVTVYSTHPGGGGFGGVDYYVEGISYQLAPLQDDEWDVTLTLDLSPRAYYATMPATWNPPG